MSREKLINGLVALGTTYVDIQTLEKLAGESDVLHDAVFLITSLLISTDDDSYDFVEGSDFPLRIRFDKGGLSVLAPCIHSDMPGTPKLMRGGLEWGELTDSELDGLRYLALQLLAKDSPLAQKHLAEVIEAQSRMTSYKVRSRLEGRKREITTVIWDEDIPELEQHIREQFGDRLVSLELLGPMETP